MKKRKLNVLVACESSGTVRDAFRKLGHNAWSCDLLPCDADPRYHVQGDVLAWLRGEDMKSVRVGYAPVKWDLMIAHPPCTYLCNSGVCWLYRDMPIGGPYVSHKFVGKTKIPVHFELNTERFDAMLEAARFFNQLRDAKIPHIAVENPIQHSFARERIVKYDQIIQPYMFGHLETKATCLWLKGLPKLVPTVDPKEGKRQTMLRPKWERSRLHYLRPGPDRWKQRSKTFQGIANAMAEQWSKHIIENT